MSVSTCWVVERHDLPLDGGNAPFRYWTFPQGYWSEVGDAFWDGNWERAVKFFDRESAELVCADMPFEWDVKIVEHQVG